MKWVLIKHEEKEITCMAVCLRLRKLQRLLLMKKKREELQMQTDTLKCFPTSRIRHGV